MSPPSANRPVSSLLRHLSVFVVGVIVGGMASFMLVRALQARADPFPRALMQVMERQLQQLQVDAAAASCDPADAAQRLQSLRGLAGELEAAFPGLAADTRFARQATRLRTTLDAAQAAPPAACEPVLRTADDIEAACRGCHQDFR